MLKYYLFLALIVVGALLYAYLADPCNHQLRADFSATHPSYTILDADAEEGSPESVRCRITYRKPGSQDINESIWLYQNPRKQGWRFSRVLETEGDQGEPSP